MTQSTGQPTRYPQDTPVDDSELLTLCVGCGAPVLSTTCILTGGVRVGAHLQPDMGVKDHRPRFYRATDGVWVRSIAAGRWMEHYCDE